MQVHRTLGPGFLESIYQRALLRELGLRGLEVRTQLEVEVMCRDAIVGIHRLDLVVENQVIVELKAIGSIAAIHQSQAISYLKATGLRVALIINFGEPSLRWKRLVRSN